jgi:hypothetical protein
MRKGGRGPATGSCGLRVARAPACLLRSVWSGNPQHASGVNARSLEPNNYVCRRHCFGSRRPGRGAERRGRTGRRDGGNPMTAARLDAVRRAAAASIRTGCATISSQKTHDIHPIERASSALVSRYSENPRYSTQNDRRSEIWLKSPRSSPTFTSCRDVAWKSAISIGPDTEHFPLNVALMASRAPSGGPILPLLPS